MKISIIFSLKLSNLYLSAIAYHQNANGRLNIKLTNMQNVRFKLSASINMNRLYHVLVSIVLWAYIDGAHAVSNQFWLVSWFTVKFYSKNSKCPPFFKQLTVEEAHELMKSFHTGCHKAFPVDETLIDEANLGRFADNRDFKVNWFSRESRICVSWCWNVSL